MKIGKKLALGILGIVLPVLFTGFVMMIPIKKELSEFEGLRIPALFAIQAIAAETMRGVEESFSYVVSGDKGEKELFFSWARTFNFRIEEFEKIIKINESSEKSEKELIGKIVAGAAILARKAEAFFNEFEARGSISPATFTDYQDAIGGLESDLSRMVEHEKEEVDKARQNIIKLVEKSERVVYGMGMFLVALALVLGYFTARNIVVPIRRLTGAVIKMDKENSFMMTDVKSKDEIGALAAALNKMAGSLSASLPKENELTTGAVEIGGSAANQLQESGARYKALFDGAAEGVIVIDEESGQISQINPEACRMFGYTEEEFLRLGISSVFSKEDLEHAMAELRARAQGKKSSTTDLRCLRKNGNMFYANINSSEITIDGCSYRVAFFSDITARKKADEHMLLMVHELQKARDEANSATHAKSQFLAAMSHEIRTPLSAVIGFTDILSQTPLSDDQKRYVNTMGSSGRILLNLINDILDFSKIEAGKITLEEADFNLRQLMKEVFRIVAARIQDADITTYVDLDEDLPACFRGDPARIQQILINLLNNAVKFTVRGEVGLIVKPSGETTLPDEVGILMIVKDTGVGLSKDELGLLFKPFSQADMSTTRKYGGTGLGLSICKSLIENMGGRVWVESEKGVGSEFKFTVKLKKGTEPVEGKITPLPSEKLAGKKVLIVDDNKVSQEILRRYCCDMGLSVLFITSSAKEAIEHVRGLSGTGAYPDIVLSDICMPDMDGYQLVKELNVLFPASGMKFIAISSDFWSGTVKELKQESFHASILKPVFRDDLIRVIRAVLGDGPSEEEAYKGSAKNELTGEGLRVLVVEDAKTNRDLVAIFLTGWGCLVDFAENGKEALEKLRANKYDLCLMDLQMPVMGGLEAVQIIRQEISEDLPVIALTAAATNDARITCLGSGMTDYIMKPVNVEELKEKVIKYGRPV